MTTILTAGDSDGTRHCDSRCYDAKGSVCTCCCNGRNHGAGLQSALEMNRAFVEGLAYASSPKGRKEPILAVQFGLTEGKT